jgi:hypothetical protein
MDLKGYRLWDMCQINSTCRAPPRRLVVHRDFHRGGLENHPVVLVVFGYSLRTRGDLVSVRPERSGTR